MILLAKNIYSSGRSIPLPVSTGYFLVVLLILNSSFMFLSGFKDEVLIASTLFSVFCFFRYGYTLSRNIFFLFLVLWFTLWLLMGYVKWEVWNWNTVVGFYLRMIFAFMCIRMLGGHLFQLFEDITFRLTLLSLPLFVIGLLIPEGYWGMHGLLSMAPDVFQIDAHAYETEPKDSLFIYGFSVNRLEQNHGFMWEPTAFATVLVLSIIYRLGINRFEFDKRLAVLLVGLATTLSTTGTIVLCTMVWGFYLKNKSIEKRYFVFLLMIPLLTAIASQEYIFSKVVEEFSNGRNQFETSEDSITGNTRLSSFLYDMDDFIENPILGISIFRENRFSGHQKIDSVNSISNTLVQLGGLGAGLIFLLYALSFRKLANRLGVRGWPYLLGAFLMLCWSEGLMLLPLFQAMAYFAVVDE